jgi:hypothetical protein
MRFASSIANGLESSIIVGIADFTGAEWRKDFDESPLNLILSDKNRLFLFSIRNSRTLLNLNQGAVRQATIAACGLAECLMLNAMLSFAQISSRSPFRQNG